jgi:predicted esterase
MSSPDPHADQPVYAAGAALGDARLAVVLLHGRGAGAPDMLGFAGELHVPGVAFLVPQAQGSTWYPQRFLAPFADNEPWLSSALEKVDRVVRHAAASVGGHERVVVAGFSQGACLALEYVVRHARRYAGVAGLSGGLIGPPGSSRDLTGSLEGTPGFLGCSDRDPHIPVSSVDEAADVLTRLGAAVTQRIYPGMGHTINADEIEAVRAMLADHKSAPA